MKTQVNVKAIPYPGLLEIIFSSKNKEYGAYALRKSYKKNVNTATIITILFFSLSLSLLLLKSDDNKDVKPPITIGTTLTKINVETENHGKFENIPLVNTQLYKPSIKFLIPKVVTDSEVPDDAVIPTIPEMEGKQISTETRGGNSAGIEFIPEEIPLKDNPLIVEPVEKEFTWVEEMPSYPGGDDALMNFISSNINYPEIARKAGIEGRVIIQFVVEKDGSITDIQVVKSLGGGCDEEALRVLRQSGKWNPGRQNGKDVRVKMIIPFSFQLN